MIDGMKFALEEAQKAYDEDEVPVGACIIRGDQLISVGHNRREQKQEITSHAEIEAIQKASQVLGSWRLEGCDLYVTLEPCLMCAGAIIQARIRKLFYGAKDPKTGVAGSVLDLFSKKLFNHSVEVYNGIYEDRCSQLLRLYFKKKRGIGEVAELDEGARLEIE
ncbi:tRNA adenosine(34) deaminase TadA [Atribacter laminatus]|jgi:tRNA(adenine34) deaminase|uniref:tRNA adenosine(34) deaminase TadA n=1 Tax=Atribacter laminatus TaxID=2847778 RepID=UPI001C4014C6